MISNSIRAGSLRVRARTPIQMLTWRKMCLSNNFCHSHIKSVSHRVQLCRYHWPFLHTYIQRRMMVSHTFCTSTLFHRYIYIKYNWLPSSYDKAFYTFLLCMVIRQHKKKTISNQDDYSYYLFIFTLKIISSQKIEHENKQSN